MPKHIVICKKCGRQFDASFGAKYDKKSRRYICHRCYNTNTTLWLNQKPWALILKAMMSFTFFLAAFSPDTEKEGWFSTSVIAFLIGLAFLAWILIPFLKQRRIKAEEKETVEQIRKDIESKVKVCPHCGAHTKGSVCEYCGSPLE